ncbi:MAG: hypothetical protein Salg2KO_00880 [Salibacteraceae bacterium]
MNQNQNMKFFLIHLFGIGMLFMVGCTSDCTQPIPQYCQLIDYDANHYEPVCGCDGENYTNVAVAECQYGMLDHVPGECE